MSQPEVPHFPMIIGGQPVSSGERHEVRNPFDLSLVGTCPVGTVDDVDRAVAAARAAFPEWAALGNAARAHYCTRIGDVFQAHAGELARLITLEQGRPIIANGFGSQFELGGCVGWSMATAQFGLDDRVVLEGGGVRAVQKRVPKGVVGSITPWNWPLLIAVWHLLPALRAGNCVVMKPSPFTPLSTLRAAELLNQILPAGVFNVVTGDGEVGTRLSLHEGIDKVIFTGSTATGKRVMQNAALNVTDCTLELGGNDAAVVLPGAAIADIAPGLFFGAFINAGQTCGAIKRIYVSNDQHDALAEALAAIASGTTVGNGLEASSDMGPLQNAPQHAKVKALIVQAVRDGANLLAGGTQVGEGYGLTPAVLANCTQAMGIVAQEQFGPAIPLVRYDTLDQAIAMANASEYGLCASVWGSDPQGLAATGDALDAGTVYINTHAELNPLVPFGGHKQSGLGTQFGEEGLLAFTDSKIVYERSRA